MESKNQNNNVRKNLSEDEKQDILNQVYTNHTPVELFNSAAHADSVKHSLVNVINTLERSVAEINIKLKTCNPHQVASYEQAKHSLEITIEHMKFLGKLMPTKRLIRHLIKLEARKAAEEVEAADQ